MDTISSTVGTTTPATTTTHPRKAAKVLALVHYHSAKPCHRGHSGPRFTSGWTCIQCLTERTKARRALAKAALLKARLWLGSSLRLMTVRT
jgi:hypothetical protein